MPWTISDTGGSNALRLQTTFSALDGAEVKWGWTEDSQDYPDGQSIHQRAAVHHFGATIENGFGRGIRIQIPARPILTETFERNAEQLVVLSEALNDEIIDTMVNDVRPALRVIGQFAQTNMVLDFDRAQGELEPLAPSTIANKARDGRSRPEQRLEETGHLRSQVRFEITT